MLPIRWRLTVWFSFLLGLTLVASALLIYTILGHQLTSEVDERLQQLANNVHRDLNIPQQENLDLSTIASGRLAPGYSELSAPGSYVQIVDDRGAVVAASANLQEGHIPEQPWAVWEGLRGRVTVETLVTASRERVRVRTVPMIHGNSVIGLIQVAQSLRHVDQTLQWLGVLLGGGVLSIWGLATLVGWGMAGRALRPISAITETAASIAATGDFGHRILEIGPRDEVARLAGTFNRMIDRVESTLQAQKQFIADSSHELGTPIAVIRGNADLLSKGLPPEDAREAILAIQSESARMERIVCDLLDMAELDVAQEGTRRTVRLDNLARAVFCHVRPAARGRHLILHRLDPVSVVGDPDRLRQLLLNLVDNAIKYTPAGGRIALSAQGDGRWGELVVSDTGIGIPPDEQEKIFRRFYRTDKARSRAGGGTGLGLAIAKAIAESHGGEITVSSRPGSGSTFTVRLPTACRLPPCRPTAD